MILVIVPSFVDITKQPFTILQVTIDNGHDPTAFLLTITLLSLRGSTAANENKLR